MLILVYSTSRMVSNIVISVVHPTSVECCYIFVNLYGRFYLSGIKVTSLPNLCGTSYLCGIFFISLLTSTAGSTFVESTLAISVVHPTSEITHMQAHTHYKKKLLDVFLFYMIWEEYGIINIIYITSTLIAEKNVNDSILFVIHVK